MINIASKLGDMGIGLTPMTFALVSVFVGMLALLYGYRLLRLFIFMIGFTSGTFIISIFAEIPVAILGGLVVGVLCCVLWYLGVFVLGAVLGILVAMALGIREQTLIIIVAGIFGMLATFIRKLMVIVSTSWLGANLVTVAISTLLNLHDASGRIGIAIVITIVGITCQYTITSGKRKVEQPSPTVNAKDDDPLKSDKTTGQTDALKSVTRGNS